MKQQFAVYQDQSGVTPSVEIVQSLIEQYFPHEVIFVRYSKSGFPIVFADQELMPRLIDLISTYYGITAVEEVVPVKIVNLTPHEIVVVRSANEMQTFPSQGCARLVEERVPALPITDDMSGCPIQSCYIRFGRIDGLPEPQENTLYVVSALVGPIAAASGRHDILSPDTGKAIRENGAIVGVPGFVRY